MQMLIDQNSKHKTACFWHVVYIISAQHPALRLWHDNKLHQWSYNRPASKPPTGNISRDVSLHTKLLTYIRWRLSVTVCRQVSIKLYLPIFTTILWLISHSLYHFQKHSL